MSIPKVSAHQSERKKLERAGTLHWFHWLIVSLSLLLTLFAWHFTKQELNEKVEAKFERETNHAIELVLERMIRDSTATSSPPGRSAPRSLTFKVSGQQRV